MKKILATAAVLAFAGSAFAGSFAVTASADFGGFQVEGSQGSALTWDGAANFQDAQAPNFNLTLFGFGIAHTGARIATPNGTIGGSVISGTAFAPGGSQDSSSFTHAWYTVVEGGTQSAMVDFGGTMYPAVQLMIFQPGITNIRLADEGGTARIGLDGSNDFVNFDAPSERGFQLVVAPSPEGDGYQTLYVALIPTPGAAGLLGLAGLAAVRRRR